VANLLIFLLMGVGVLVLLPANRKALLGLLKDRKELARFALFEAVAIGAFALALIVFGLPASAVLLLACVGLFAIWAMKPPAKPR
jgi:hypothetical protein